MKLHKITDKQLKFLLSSIILSAFGISLFNIVFWMLCSIDYILDIINKKKTYIINYGKDSYSLVIDTSMCSIDNRVSVASLLYATWAAITLGSTTYIVIQNIIKENKSYYFKIIQYSNTISIPSSNRYSTENGILIFKINQNQDNIAYKLDDIKFHEKNTLELQLINYKNTTNKSILVIKFSDGKVHKLIIDSCEIIINFQKNKINFPYKYSNNSSYLIIKIQINKKNSCILNSNNIATLEKLYKNLINHQGLTITKVLSFKKNQVFNLKGYNLTIYAPNTNKIVDFYDLVTCPNKNKLYSLLRILLIHSDKTSLIINFAQAFTEKTLLYFEKSLSSFEEGEDKPHDREIQELLQIIKYIFFNNHLLEIETEKSIKIEINKIKEQCSSYKKIVKNSKQLPFNQAQKIYLQKIDNEINTLNSLQDLLIKNLNTNPLTTLQKKCRYQKKEHIQENAKNYIINQLNQSIIDERNAIFEEIDKDIQRKDLIINLALEFSQYNLKTINNLLPKDQLNTLSNQIMKCIQDIIQLNLLNKMSLLTEDTSTINSIINNINNNSLEQDIIIHFQNNFKKYNDQSCNDPIVLHIKDIIHLLFNLHLNFDEKLSLRAKFKYKMKMLQSEMHSEILSSETESSIRDIESSIYDIDNEQNTSPNLSHQREINNQSEIQSAFQIMHDNSSSTTSLGINQNLVDNVKIKSSISLHELKKQNRSGYITS